MLTFPSDHTIRTDTSRAVPFKASARAAIQGNYFPPPSLEMARDRVQTQFAQLYSHFAPTPETTEFLCKRRDREFMRMRFVQCSRFTPPHRCAADDDRAKNGPAARDLQMGAGREIRRQYMNCQGTVPLDTVIAGLIENGETA